jgi:RNA polymerase sigma factor (TIGR02999 family)
LEAEEPVMRGKGCGVVLQPSPKLVTELLAKWRAGDQQALGALVPLVYNELREVAHRYLRHERPDHTLQSTALVHEAYLRLRKQGAQEFKNRAHFFAIAAQLMRQILVDYARHQKAAKRNAECRLTLDDTVQLLKARSVDLVALDHALDDLAKLDSRQSRIVELRFFGGLSLEEISSVLGVSPTTVKRDWTTARIWLYHQITRSA